MTTRKTICFGAMKMNLPLPLLFRRVRPLMARATNGVGKSAERKEGRKGPLFSGRKINDGFLFPPSIYPYDDDDLLTKRAALILFR